VAEAVEVGVGVGVAEALGLADGEPVGLAEAVGVADGEGVAGLLNPSSVKLRVLIWTVPVPRISTRASGNPNRDMTVW
jgi:hypothetical protein